MAEPASSQLYSRQNVRRLLDVPERELTAWEREGLIPRRDHFTFADLLALKTLSRLRENRVPVTQIRLAMEALREKLHGIENPLTDLKIVSEGKRMKVLVDGQPMEPVSGQLLLNFDQAALNRLLSFPAKPAEQQPSPHQRAEAETWFEKGVTLEQTGAPLAQIVEAYEQAVKLDPQFGGALVNLGTVYFKARKFREAERYYQKALAAQPDYALAHFNIANLYDERGERDQALQHYQTALRLHPQYADAHYNIALLYQTLGQTLKAVHHWQTFLKLDPAGSWADIARREIEKLRRSMVVQGARKTAPGDVNQA